jgi:hypothetical protein
MCGNESLAGSYELPPLVSISISVKLSVLDFQDKIKIMQKTRIQQAYEKNSPLYTTKGATRQIAESRDRVLKAKRRKEEGEIDNCKVS